LLLPTDDTNGGKFCPLGHNGARDRLAAGGIGTIPANLKKTKYMRSEGVKGTFDSKIRGPLCPKWREVSTITKECRVGVYITNGVGVERTKKGLPDFRGI